MDYRKLVKALVVLILGIFLGKPITGAVSGAIDAYESATSATQTAVKQNDATE